MNWHHNHMEPENQLFLHYSPPNGLPQESKLVTYMNRSSPAPMASLNQCEPIETTPTSGRKMVLREMQPMPYFSPHTLEHIPQPPMNHLPRTSEVHQENVGGTTYFFAKNTDNNTGGAAIDPCRPVGIPMPGPSTLYPAHSHYSGTLTNMAPTTSKTGLAASFHTLETIRSEIYKRNEHMLMHCVQEDLPENVDLYTDLMPLESTQHTMASSYRATDRATGTQVALRRLHSYSPVISKRLGMWKHIDHPNIVKIHDYFLTEAFGDISLILVYNYHPVCETLMAKFLSGGAANNISDANGAFHDPFSSDPDAPRPYTHQKNTMLRAVASGALLPEAELWSILVQLTAALRAIHSAGLACRTLNPTKVVMNGCRVRIAWCAVADARCHCNNIAQAQQDDLTSLGRLALVLACRNIHCDNLATSMELITRTYSPDLKNLILYLLASSARRSVTDLMPMIGARFYTQVEALERRADVLEDELALQIDNERLLRIVMKLGIINERPELNMDLAWSETGGRYLLKLFRDYIFHTVKNDGKPFLDQAHIIHCLNHLDSGSPTKQVQLTSRDGLSVLVVSYAELKQALEKAFEDVYLYSGEP